MNRYIFESHDCHLATSKSNLNKTMADRKELNSLNTQLVAEFKKGFTDVKKCAEILEQLKVVSKSKAGLSWSTVALTV